jgi:hypothetical protein
MQHQCICTDPTEFDLKSPSFLEDVTFIRDKYKDLFISLEITNSDDFSVSFDLVTLNHKSTHVTLSADSAYTIIRGDSAGESFESFEQLLLRLMGPLAYAELISSLVAQKLQSPSNSLFCVTDLTLGSIR